VERKARKRKAPPKGAQVVIGIDGALLDDALAVVACEIKTGFMWPLGIWERPADAGPDYEHPKMRSTVRLGAFETYSVWRMYCDDQWIEDLIERWQNRYGEKRVIVWRTNRLASDRVGDPQLRAGRPTAKSELTHSGDETLTRHIANSRKRMLTCWTTASARCTPSPSPPSTRR
jgi:hypothetical protein